MNPGVPDEMPGAPAPEAEPHEPRKAGRRAGARPRRGRIVFSLVAVLAFVGLAPLASVAWKLTQLNREALATARQEVQLLLVGSIASSIETRTEAARARVSTLADSIGAADRRGTLSTETLARSRDRSADDYIVYLRFDGATGVRVASDATSPPPEPLVRAIESSVAAWGRTNDPGARARISNPVLLPGTPGDGSEPFLVYSAPVVARGQFRGVLSAVVHFGAVWDEITARSRTGETLFAIDPSGVPFASSDPTSVRPGADLAGSGLVQRFLSSRGRASETAPFDWALAGTPERFLGSYHTTEDGWGVFAQAPEASVYQPIRAMMTSTGRWALVALGLAILAAIVFARTLSTPVQRLAAAARGFGAGDFRIRVKDDSRNEIGELAETFNAMADVIEDHIERLKRAARENNELFLGTIRVLANAIDAKDPYTRGHSLRVNRYSVILARHLKLSRRDLDEIHVASVLHDVGKIGIDDHILKKPGALTRDEFEVMKTHTVRGAAMMQPIRKLQRIIPGLRSHHERWNGTGYPDGLAGEDIPLMGRIIAVADTFDAMTTERPYQKAFSFEAARARINELNGVAFDTRVVEAFNLAFEAGEFGDAPMAAETIESIAAG